MLGLVVRGVLLVVFLGWYSSSVWRMIDGYFKDRFQQYLHNEYKINPRIREDIESYALSEREKSAPPAEKTEVSDTTTAAISRETERDKDVVGERASRSNVRRIDSPAAAAHDQSVVAVLESGPAVPVKSDDMSAGSAGENGDGKAATAVIDKNAFLGSSESSARPHHASRKTRVIRRDEATTIIRDVVADNNKRRQLNYDGEITKIAATSIKGRTRQKNKRRSIRFPSGATARKGSLLPESIDVKLTSCTLEYDFSEFDETEGDNMDSRRSCCCEDEERVEGIRVKDLPFKPRLDIGQLERVTPDEYCPLTLDEEATCGETAKWP